MIATSQKTSLTSQKASSLGTWKPATTGVCRTKLQLSRDWVVVKRRSLTEDWQRAVLCPAMDCYSSLVGREGAEVVVKQCPHCPAVDSTSIVVQGGTLVELFRILTTTKLAKYKILVPPSLDNHVTKLEHSLQPVFTSLNNKFTSYYRLDRVYYRRRRYIYVSSRDYTSD